MVAVSPSGRRLAARPSDQRDLVVDREPARRFRDERVDVVLPEDPGRAALGEELVEDRGGGAHGTAAGAGELAGEDLLLVCAPVELHRGAAGDVAVVQLHADLRGRLKAV